MLWFAPGQMIIWPFHFSSNVSSHSRTHPPLFTRIMYNKSSRLSQIHNNTCSNRLSTNILQTIKVSFAIFGAGGMLIKLKGCPLRTMYFILSANFMSICQLDHGIRCMQKWHFDQRVVYKRKLGECPRWKGFWELWLCSVDLMAIWYFLCTCAPKCKCYRKRGSTTTLGFILRD